MDSKSYQIASSFYKYLLHYGKISSTYNCLVRIHDGTLLHPFLRCKVSQIRSNPQ